MEMLLPTLRADFELCDTYRFETGEPLTAPITVYGGADDETLRRAREEWQDADSAANVLERALPAASAQGRVARMLRGAIRTLSSVEAMTEVETEEAFT